MTDFHAIYRDRADDYDLMVAREDYQGNIARTLRGVVPLDGLDVVEFGAGTGRLTRLLAPRVGSLRAYDASEAMLAVARRHLETAGAANCTLAVAENESLPCEPAIADLSIAGWTFGHLTGWHPADWPGRIERVLAEMRRVTRPGGMAVILETLGTGRKEPKPPNAALAEYYRLLEAEHAFTRIVLRTDYRFESVEEADRLTRFFFGEEFADGVTRSNSPVVPECTGLWHARFD